MQTAALVSRTGCVDWLCFPRFDSPACFAALLGDANDGVWRLAPDGAGECNRRRYRDDSLILESEWETADGAVRIIDFMPPRGAAPDIVRIVEGISVRVDMTYSSDYKLPADVKAAIITPTLVADRFVQLVPAYSGTTWRSPLVSWT